MVDYRNVDASVPLWIQQMVKKDNVEFVIDRQVFNSQFFYLIKLVLKHISADLSMTQHVYDLAYLPYFHRMHSAALKIGHKVMFDMLSHYSENGCLAHISDYMATMFTFSDSWINFVRKAEEPSLICQWIEDVLLEDRCAYFFHLMFHCPFDKARTHCGQVVANAVNKGFRILAALLEKPMEREHPKVQRLRTTLETFLNLATDVVFTRESQKNWVKLEQFYQMLAQISLGGRYQAELLLRRNNGSLVVELSDLIMQNRSPKAKA